MGTGSDFLTYFGKEVSKSTSVPYTSYPSTSSGTTLTEENIRKALQQMYDNDTFLASRYGATPVQTPQDELFRAIERNIYLI